MGSCKQQQGYFKDILFDSIETQLREAGGPGERQQHKKTNAHRIHSEHDDEECIDKHHAAYQVPVRQQGSSSKRLLATPPSHKIHGC